jgi:outer membrane receptor protein involved in Fe transport
MRNAVDTAVSETVRVQGVAPAIDVAGAASLGVLSADDIRLRHPATLAQALDDLPGVRAISEGQAQTPAIRGLARGRTLVLLDGLRVSTERGAGTNASFLDPADLGRVDVARGPGSVAYGSDAFGGVVAATTRQPVADSPMRVTFGGTLGAGVPERRADLEWSGGYPSGAFLVGIRRREFDDYSSPHGIVPLSSWEDTGVRLSWEDRRGSQAWAIGWQRDEARNIGRPRSDSDAIRAVSPFERSHRLTIG